MVEWEGFKIVSKLRSGRCEVSTSGLYSSGVSCVGGGRVDRFWRERGGRLLRRGGVLFCRGFFAPSADPWVEISESIVVSLLGCVYRVVSLSRVVRHQFI